jgi:hypothetical protein
VRFGVLGCSLIIFVVNDDGRIGVCGEKPVQLVVEVIHPSIRRRINYE